MAMRSLPPGFRFHPTDLELVLYYLKRKALGKRLHYEIISEVNIYKFSPWDLPDKSCLRSKDQEWFFFCPREKKYASGSRVKRSTENGYWKTTGKDRNVRCNDKIVGSVKTLVFHLGHPPQGERTDWVIHEYMILDNNLAAAGVQDTYVLCKLFKKNGMGPKNGAQYGAPFNEADWADNDIDDGNHAISFASDGPLPAMPVQTEEQSFPPERSLSAPAPAPAPGNTSGLPLHEEGPSPPVVGPTSEAVAADDEMYDEILSLLAPFGDADQNGISQDYVSGNVDNIPLSCCSDGCDLYNGLGDLGSWDQTNEVRDFSGLQNDEYFLNNMLPQDNSTYIELDDLRAPLDCPIGTHQSSLCEVVGTVNHENVQQYYSGDSFVVVGHHASCANDLPPPYNEGGDNWSDVHQMVNHQIWQGSNASYNLDFTSGQLDNAGYSPNMERGRCADN